MVKDFVAEAPLATAFSAHKIDALTQEPAALVAALEEKHLATFHRTINPDKSIRVSLEFASGDRVSGNGATTELALAHLCFRMETWPDA